MDFPLRDFLLQIEDNGHYSEDTAVVERIISEKNWLSRNNLFIGIEETIGSIKGYFHGLITAGARYLPQLAVSALTLATSFGKSDIAKKASYIGAIGIAVAHGFDFIHNTLYVGEKNNQLK